MADGASAWLDRFPALQAIRDPDWLSALADVRRLRLPQGVTAFHAGDAPQSYLLVLSGVVRVQKLSESGKEIVLYRVEAGQSCILTTSCLLARDLYQAEAITETEVEAVAIPQPAFERALASPGFREFVFASYGERVSGLVMLIDAVAFGRMDQRLAHALIKLADGTGRIAITHQDLARELGTAREVVSRLLKEFERRGMVALQRGSIQLLRPEDLAAEL